MRRTIVQHFSAVHYSLFYPLFVFDLPSPSKSRRSERGRALFLNFYSFYYFGLCLVSATAFLYFFSERKTLPRSFLGFLTFLGCLFLWSLTWAICNSFLSPWTAYVFVFLKNPAVVFLGNSLIATAFHFQGDNFPRQREIVGRISLALTLFAILGNGVGFFFREIKFETKMEFYVPEQSSSHFWVQMSIIIIALTLCIQLIATLTVLTIKLIHSSRSIRIKIRNFLFAILAIFSLAVADMLVDLGYIEKSTYLFILTNVTIIAVTVIILSSLNQENIPSTVGFKVMTFNITLMYLTLSVIANILFNRYKIDFQTDMNREQEIVRSQIERNNFYPIIYQSDLVIDLEAKRFRINKLQKPYSDLKIPAMDSIPFYEFRIFQLYPNPDGIFWVSSFYANNTSFMTAISYRDYRKNIEPIVIWLIITLLISLMLVFLLYPLLHKKNIVEPLNLLLDGIRKMQKGDLDVRVEVLTQDEIGQITSSFNQMIYRVKTSHDDLEQKIQMRTVELHDKLKELKETQSQLVLAERMSTLGKIAASVAHEINNPLAAIKASASFLRSETVLSPPSSEKAQDATNIRIANELIFGNKPKSNLEGGKKIKKKREMERFFESLDYLDPAGLADTCSDLGIESIEEEHKSLFQTEAGKEIFVRTLERAQVMFHLSIIETAVKRASKIVFALKHYSYAGPKENKTVFSLMEGIDAVIVMYSATWKQGIEIETEYSDETTVLGYPDELVQVWTNLIYNAVQACPPHNGKIKIQVSRTDRDAFVSIRDNGNGISQENLDLIFEPFFTTKELGMGTGLGLPIVKKIIENHEGEISVESQPGDTIFRIRLPLHL